MSRMEEGVVELMRGWDGYWAVMAFRGLGVGFFSMRRNWLCVLSKVDFGNYRSGCL